MFNPSYTYEDIGLVPKQLSTIKSRDDVKVKSIFLGHFASLPILAAPMRKVVGVQLAEAIRDVGGLVVLPRDNSATFSDYKAVHQISIPSVHAGLSSPQLIAYLKDHGRRPLPAICIDVANGFHAAVGRAVEIIKEQLPETKIIAGNVASVAGYEYLAELGVDAVRVGIGGGAGCTTSIATGVGVGQASLIRELAKYRNKYRDRPARETCTYHYEEEDCCNCVSQSKREKWPLIIADGGIKNAGDVCKAIALGADITMAGFIFAGAEESPGEVIKFQGKKYKQYAGEASFAVKRSNKYVEGDETLVPYSGPVAATWHRFEDGIRSAMSYMNAKTLEELRYLPDACFTLLSTSAKRERSAAS